MAVLSRDPETAIPGNDAICNNVHILRQIIDVSLSPHSLTPAGVCGQAGDSVCVTVQGVLQLELLLLLSEKIRLLSSLQALVINRSVFIISW